MNLLDDDTPPPTLTARNQAPISASGRRSLPPATAFDSQHALPSYPSSTLQHYYPSPHHVANYAHIFPPYQPFQPHSSVINDPSQMPLPSASQSHIPSLRHSPSSHSLNNIHIQNASAPPLVDRHSNSHSCASHHDRIHSASPVVLTQPQNPPFIQPQTMPYYAPQPTHPLPTQFAPLHQPHLPPHFVPLHQPHFLATVPQIPNSQTSYINSSLPSTKDVPILTGKHDWGPWHSAVRTLILNANLLGHIADDPLPGAIFDPGLRPTYPPAIHQRSTHAELQSFTEWWSHDGLASHILTSRLSPSVLGSLPIPNKSMGQRRSARTVYLTLRVRI